MARPLVGMEIAWKLHVCACNFHTPPTRVQVLALLSACTLTERWIAEALRATKNNVLEVMSVQNVEMHLNVKVLAALSTTSMFNV